MSGSFFTRPPTYQGPSRRASGAPARGARAGIGAAAAGLALALAAAPARARGPILPGDVRQVVAAGARVAAIRGDDVVVLRADGAWLGPVAAATERRGDPPRARRARGLGADEALDLAGGPDDDLESDAVEEALDDEGLRAGGPPGRARARRRGRRDDAGGGGDGGGARALAAGAQAIWAATGSGVWRIDAGGAAGPAAARVGARGLRLDALTAAETAPVLAALSGDRVVRSGDGGASWSVLAVLDAPARAVVLSRDGGDLFVLDDEGVAQIAHGERMPVGPGRARHVARCGDDLMILTDDGVYAWRWDRGSERRSGPLPARRLVCSPEAPGLILALGAGLLVSGDGARSWVVRADLPALDVQSAAIGGGRIWVGTAAGLFDAPLAAPPPPPRGAAAPEPRPTAARLGAPVAQAPVWPGLLPRVSLVLVTDTVTPGTRRGQVLLLLTFPLGRARPVGSDGLARERLRRRAAAAAELARLAAADRNDDEAAAETRALLDSLEDLR
jgi:hypothetical protein